MYTSTKHAEQITGSATPAHAAFIGALEAALPAQVILHLQFTTHVRLVLTAYCGGLCFPSSCARTS